MMQRISGWNLHSGIQSIRRVLSRIPMSLSLNIRYLTLLLLLPILKEMQVHRLTILVLQHCGEKGDRDHIRQTPA